MLRNYTLGTTYGIHVLLYLYILDVYGVIFNFEQLVRSLSQALKEEYV